MLMGFKTTEEVFAIYKPEKKSILLGKSLVPWLCDVLKKYLHRE